MTPELLEEIASIASREEDAIRDSYAWPPRGPLSPEERKEANRLRVLSARIWYASRVLAWERGTP